MSLQTPKQLLALIALMIGEGALPTCNVPNCTCLPLPRMANAFNTYMYNYRLIIAGYWMCVGGRERERERGGGGRERRDDLRQIGR